jgi:hypothetical protein
MRLACITVRVERVLVFAGLSFVLGCGENSPFATGEVSGEARTNSVSAAVRNGDRMQGAVPGGAVSQPKHPLTPELKAQIESAMADPRMVNQIAKLRRVKARGPIAYAVVDSSLTAGVRAVVRLGQRGNPSRYAVVSRATFDDAAILSSGAAALSYEMGHEDDNTPVEITVYTDGHVEATSGKYGKVFVARNSHGHVEDPGRLSRRMLQMLAVAPAVDIPGFGAARIVRIPDAHDETPR